jgi:hypothetical protein
LWRERFAQAVQVVALRLGFNPTTGVPPTTASGLIQPLLGIAALPLDVPVKGASVRSACGVASQTSFRFVPCIRAPAWAMLVPRRRQARDDSNYEP